MSRLVLRKGLCKSFARDKLLTELSVNYISISITSALPARVYCFHVRAAKSIYIWCFFLREGKYLLREAEDCNLGDLDFLIFTFPPKADETVIEFSNM